MEQDLPEVEIDILHEKYMRGLIKAGEIARARENAPKVIPAHEIYYKDAFQDLKGRWKPDDHK